MIRFFLPSSLLSVDSLPKKMRSKNMALSWRRLSMRKTCPIVLPEQNLPKDAIQYAIEPAHFARTALSANRSHISANDFATNATNAPDENNEIYCFNDTMTPTAASTNAYLLSHTENNEMTAMPNGQCDHVLSTEYDSHNQLPELSSLNNEFLHTILATPNYQQSNANPSTNIHSLQHETNFVHNIEEDSDCATAFEESRPRQLGRRSEVRSRIVSITAERNAEGDQVSSVAQLIPINKNHHQFLIHFRFSSLLFA